MSKIELTIDNKQMSAYSLMMAKNYPKQMTYAVKDTLTKVAFRSSNGAKKTILPQIFTLRNKYTQRGIRYNKTKGSKIQNAYSEFGSLKKNESRLDLQEDGGTLKSKGNSLAKGTKASRMGKSYGKKVRVSFNKAPYMAVNAANFGKKQTSSNVAPKTSRGRLIGAIMWAKRTQFKGLLTSSGFNGKFGAYSVRRKKLNMIYNLESSRQKIKATHWQAKSRLKPTQQQQQIFNVNMQKQIKFLSKKGKFI